MYLRTETHFQVVSRQAQAQAQAQAQVQGNKKRQSTADDIRVRVKHTKQQDWNMPGSRQHGGGSLGRERERERQKLYTRCT